MTKEILSKDIPAPKLIRSRRRSIALEVRHDGTLVVRAPHFLPDAQIREFISKRRAWIDNVYNRTREKLQLFKPKQFVNGEKFLYLGNEYTLHITQDMDGKFLFENQFILNERYIAKAKILFERWYRQEAFMLFTKRCKCYAQYMSVSYKSISLSNAKHRWGSCYPNGGLGFNWRLVMAPECIIDYVVVHELAHLVEANHSKRFWALVEKTFPNYKEAKLWLRDNQHRLKI